MDYKVEDCKFFNERKKNYTDLDERLGRIYIYQDEKNLSQEEKIAFIDEYYDYKGQKGNATYLLNIIDKYIAEKDSMPKDKYGYVKTVSLKAWLKKNDPRHIIDDSWHYGNYHFVGREYSFFGTRSVRPVWSTKLPYYDEENNVVNFWFHDLVVDLCENEDKWYRDHDPIIGKIRKVSKYGKEYGCFNIKKFGEVVGNGERVLDKNWRRTFNEPEITEADLDEMLKVYEEVDSLMKSKKAEIVDRLGWEVYTE